MTRSATGIRVDADGPVFIVTIDRTGARNAVDGRTARELADAFRGFEADAGFSVAVLHGAHGAFCAGADLKAMTDPALRNRLEPDGDGPMGPTRMLLSKPVIASVSGHAVAGGMELALWCDLRIVERSAIFGIFCRRFGVPLIDGGTVRLPRLIGLSRALDLILTGRAIDAAEALSIGLANRLVDDGQALSAAVALAHQLAILPQTCLRNDRLSAYEQFDMSLPDALANEFDRGKRTIESGESFAGAAAFAGGVGRHGRKVN